MEEQTPKSKDDTTEMVPCYTVGSAVKKKLDYGAVSAATSKTTEAARTKKKVAPFTKRGNLSPTKNASGFLRLGTPLGKTEVEQVTAARKAFSFDDTVAQPQVKEATRPSEDVKDKSIADTSITLNKLTPQKVKANLGKVKNLSDLKERLRQQSKFKVPENNKKTVDIPKLSEGPISLSISVTSPRKTFPASPAKKRQPSLPPASPQKKVSHSVGDLLQSPSSKSKELPLPHHYMDMFRMFKIMDDLVRIKYNQQRVYRVEDLRKEMQSATRKDFKDSHLRQIRCVFPMAFVYKWERKRGRSGKQLDYELHVTPNMSYKEDMDEGKARPTAEELESTPSFVRLEPKQLAERRRIFEGLLASMVRDAHAKFLASIGLEVEAAKVTKWHEDFDIESCGEVDGEDLPERPGEVKLTTAADVISATQDLFKDVNPRLGQAVADYKKKEGTTKSAAATGKDIPAPETAIKKELQGLPTALLEKVLAREKKKQIKAMTESSEDRKERNVLEELQTIGPQILNCHRSERQSKGRAALEVKSFSKFLSNSCGGKGAGKMEDLLRALVKLAPGYLKFVTVRNVEHVKAATPERDVNSLRDEIKKQLSEKKI